MKEIRDGIVLQRTDKRTEGRKRGAVMIPGGQRVGELMTQIGQSLEVVMTPGSLRVEFIVLKEEVMKIPGGQRLAAPGARVGIMTLRPAETKTGMIKFQFFEFYCAYLKKNFIQRNANVSVITKDIKYNFIHQLIGSILVLNPVIA